MLSALIWGPILGAILIAIIPNPGNDCYSRKIALGIMTAVAAISVLLAWQFDLSNPQMQFVEYYPWLPSLGLNYHLGVDGLSLPLLLLNSSLVLISIFSTNLNLERPRFYYALLLLLSGGVAGAFLAQDLLLFFLFFELEIIPLYFLIAIWGGQRRGYAAMKFLLYTALSGFLVLVSFLGWFWLTKAPNFDYDPSLADALPVKTQMLLLLPLLLGLGIKIPIFPFHTWLPDAHVEASTPVSVLLAGVLLKLGTYGLLRFGVGLYLEAWVEFAPYLATIAAISALYGASCAIAQKDMKKVVAYSSIAHMGYILLAAAATTRLSVTAASAQMVSHGIISALLFLLVGVVYKKTGSRDVDKLQGLLTPERGLPITGSLMILGVMASAGIPGMVGFIAEFLVFRGSFPIFPVQTLLCLIGSGLTAVYFLLMINRVFFGRLTMELSHLPKVRWQEQIPAIALAVVIIVLGIQPHWLTKWSEPQTAVLLTGHPDLVSLPAPPRIEIEVKELGEV
ncbi:NADH-quinone oxidoreductase subunit M [Synechocystis sp. PCC 7339]|uniref:NADH-quinone oxidoreductase subunit M n=1 Tax=unclassified Synechocystis TaxID=2640012 RepID=UPI001BAFF739|nr:MULTISPECIES: NADH-quinone oxidoreductase subunit M [unclassified Synechocystis]QUS61420.1 NADH-quinone oxidoreductase subunit M [Synechocystis sp. PCC 7338]UAJ73601.1 NADH-quinone oxidoreductase subunit M [Synechocystis sp. PCC 7339]